MPNRAQKAAEAPLARDTWDDKCESFALKKLTDKDNYSLCVTVTTSDKPPIPQPRR